MTVQDTTPPTIGPLPDVEAPESDPLGTPVVLAAPEVTDIGDASPAVTNDAPATFPLGTTVVTWTATDKSGNSATAQQQVTIVPGTPQNRLDNLDKLIGYALASGGIAPELEQSLRAKVDAALAALGRGNANDAEAGMGDLKALVNQVEAQADKKIAPATAAEIIRRANAIVAALEA